MLRALGRGQEVIPAKAEDQATYAPLAYLPIREVFEETWS